MSIEFGKVPKYIPNTFELDIIFSASCPFKKDVMFLPNLIIT